MNLCEQIEHAFKHRLKPSRLIKIYPAQLLKPHLITTDQEDALWFSGKDWREITWNDWENYPSAISMFTPEAFIYYLPSVLYLTTKNPGEWLEAADSLLMTLNRSPNINYWDDWMVERWLGLQVEEYEVIQAWILSLSGSDTFCDEDGLVRSYETVGLLQRETERGSTTPGAG